MACSYGVKHKGTIMKDKFIVKAGGFYFGVFNSRTKRFSWVHKGNIDKLKRTETYLLTEEQANTIKNMNDHAYMKMANLTIIGA